jgi:hypothetical protein
MTAGKYGNSHNKLYAAAINVKNLIKILCHQINTEIQSKASSRTRNWYWN